VSVPVAPQPQRLALRRLSRQLLRQRNDATLHLARVQAALALSGAEPVQGVLSDLFLALGSDQQATRRAALQLCRARLSAHVAAWFDALVAAEQVPRISPLATRWSVLTLPSADISTRARRCRVDDSRALAARAVVAVAQGDQPGEQLFLHHCLTCHDNLAFMLARRQLLKTQEQLSPAWEQVSAQLEQGVASA